MVDAKPSSPPPGKSKGILGLFRKNQDAPAPSKTDDDAKQAEEGNSNVDAPSELAAVDLADEKPKDGAATSPAPPVVRTLSSAQIDQKWDEMITAAKSKTTVMTKLKRLASTGGKSKDGKTRDKGKGKAKAPELDEEDIAAMVPLPEDTEAQEGTPAPGTGIPGSNTLSKRIQVLLSSVPPFLHTVPNTGDATAPIPPMPDAKLLSYLSSPSIMNGGSVSGTTTPDPNGPPKPAKMSVWQVLDRLVPYKPPNSAPPADGEEDPEEEASESSLMLCTPLIIDDNAKVVLAQSEVIQVPVQDNLQLLPKEVAKGVSAALWPGKFRFPWSKKKPDETNEDTPPSQTPQPPATNPVKIWIPSETAMSFQVAWWGYRLWLPPPVMLILNDKTLEATKRAAMITTAIGWLINNIPVAILPPPLRAAMTLLKGIVPFLGYIGGFIAWSWSEIKSFDKGHGVVLSATWLLPIALIPSSWEDQMTKLPIGRGDTEPAPTNPAPGTSPAPTPAPGGTGPGTPTPAQPTDPGQTSPTPTL
ncbi:hypothetical protein FRB99_004793 [Tulasnella sp. 403]|nr:hypothetical protein FRB99_004793 [Tulasnella sp. 403]